MLLGLLEENIKINLTLLCFVLVNELIFLEIFWIERIRSPESVWDCNSVHTYGERASSKEKLYNFIFQVVLLIGRYAKY